MRSDSPSLRPPFIASRLVGLFTSGWHDEAISGDLLEEFSDVASKSGLTYGRRWYWRQSIKTIGNLCGAGLRTAPWLIISTTVGGYLLLAFGSSLPETLIVAVLQLRWHHVVPYYTQRQMEAHIFWLNTGTLIGRHLVSLFIGCIVAAVAKAREMVATLVLSVLLLALSVVGWFNVARHWPERAVPIMFIELVGMFLIPIGGVMVREVRRVTRARH